MPIPRFPLGHVLSPRPKRPRHERSHSIQTQRPAGLTSPEAPKDENEDQADLYQSSSLSTSSTW